MDKRDEYQIFTQPKHGFREYANAHALAGDLKLADKSPKASQRDEFTDTLGRLAKAPRKPTDNERFVGVWAKYTLIGVLVIGVGAPLVGFAISYVLHVVLKP